LNTEDYNNVEKKKYIERNNGPKKGNIQTHNEENYSITIIDEAEDKSIENYIYIGYDKTVS
jgi:hypothetical protein